MRQLLRYVTGSFLLFGATFLIGFWRLTMLNHDEPTREVARSAATGSAIITAVVVVYFSWRATRRK